MKVIKRQVFETEYEIAPEELHRVNNNNYSEPNPKNSGLKPVWLSNIKDFERAKNLENRISKLLTLKEAEEVFSEILTIKAAPAEQVYLSRLLLKSEAANRTDFRFVLEGKIKKWITRWSQHIAAAQTVLSNGPYNLALTVRFGRNYSRRECQQITRKFFKALSDSGCYPHLHGIGIAEPDRKPITRDTSFHFHASLSLPLNLDLPSLDAEVENIADHMGSIAAEIKDSRGRRAFRRSEVTDKVLGLNLQVVYDLEGWALYITKQARDEATAFADNGFWVKDGSATFICEYR